MNCVYCNKEVLYECECSRQTLRNEIIRLRRHFTPTKTEYVTNLDAIVNLQDYLSGSKDEIKRLKKIIRDAWRSSLGKHITDKKAREVIGETILILEKNSDESKSQEDNK